MLRSRLRNLPPNLKNALNRTTSLFMGITAVPMIPIRLVLYYLNKNRSTRLHVGCGSVKLKGWVNADIDPRAQLIINIKHRLPFPGNFLDRIYSEHVLEHVSADDGVTFLREAYRTLKPGGVIRIAMPDLDDLIEGYSNDWKRFDWLQWPGHEFIQTKAEMLNIAFRWWGHLYLYNQEELDRRLCEAGFSAITFCEQGKSQHGDLRDLETRNDSMLIAEATK